MTTDATQRLGTWILTRCAPEYRRESLIGDLIEQYAERGGWWYWYQVLSAVRVRAVTATLAARQTRVSAAEFVDDLVMSIALSTVGFCQLPFCAICLLGWATFGRSRVSLVENALIGGALIGTATAAYALRARRAREPRLPHFPPAW